MSFDKKIALVAIGGNSLVKKGGRASFEEQYSLVCETVKHIADIIDQGFQVCISHGNGPQVGFMLLRSELGTKHAALHPEPLVACVADTQGSIGWHIQQALGNELRQRQGKDKVACIITQVLVDPDDAAFKSPEKFVGGFFEASELDSLKQNNPDWVLKEDSGRGWRRVVPSPNPLKIMELEAIKELLGTGYNVIAVGGGGIPVVESPKGQLCGVDAVVDKDLASSLLAASLGAGVFVISTGVDKVYINYNGPKEKGISKISAGEIRKLYNDGHFPAGSMGPKIKAALNFLDKGGEKVIITSPENLKKAFLGEAGTQIFP